MAHYVALLIGAVWLIATVHTVRSLRRADRPTVRHDGHVTWYPNGTYRYVRPTDPNKLSEFP